MSITKESIPEFASKTQIEEHLSSVKNTLIKKFGNEFYKDYLKALNNKEPLDKFYKEINKKFINKEETDLEEKELYNGNIEQYAKIYVNLHKIDNNSSNKMLNGFLRQVQNDSLHNKSFIRVIDLIGDNIKKLGWNNDQVKDLGNKFIELAKKLYQE
ncbi:MAG: hypothetical protein RCG15_09030 [Candidatus Rickettsia vulgarisii]